MSNNGSESSKVVEAAYLIHEEPCTFVCPRCGRVVDNTHMHGNVQSRYAEINICSVCDIEEAMLGDILPLRRWHEKSLQGK